MTAKDAGWPWIFGKLYGLTHRNPRSNRVVVSAADLSPGERVLDVGCGAGGALVLAAAIVGSTNVAGAEPTAALASTAASRIPGARIENAPAERLPFFDGEFDVVWSVSSFHHWQDPELGLRETARVLAPGGRMLIAEHSLRRDGGHGISDREADRLEETLTDLGMENARAARHGSGRNAVTIVSAVRPLRAEISPDT